VSDRNGAPLRVTSEVASPAELPFVSPTTIRVPSFDGRLIPAYWYRPSSGTGPWPVVIDVHGGPESQRRPEFAAVTQAFLANGIAVLAPNVRGSTGYGKTYCHLDDRERRPDAVADLDAAGAWLREQRDVDPSRIAVMGQSYGGFMVLAALTTYPEAWAAGVDVVGIADFVSFLERTGPWRRKVREDEYGSLATDAELLREISPLHRAERITAPLFVIHGRNDPRVPLFEAEQIVARLRALGRDVELLVFDDEGHGLVKRPNRRTGYGAIGAFLAGRLGIAPRLMARD
jgi:dipeptidyl aminopeptidase/acylaminoacyl peptidase